MVERINGFIPQAAGIQDLEMIALATISERLDNIVNSHDVVDLFTWLKEIGLFLEEFGAERVVRTKYFEVLHKAMTFACSNNLYEELYETYKEIEPLIIYSEKSTMLLEIHYLACLALYRNGQLRQAYYLSGIRLQEYDRFFPSYSEKEKYFNLMSELEKIESGSQEEYEACLF